jgi:hypothetical protein
MSNQRSFAGLRKPELLGRQHVFEGNACLARFFDGAIFNSNNVASPNGAEGHERVLTNRH